MGVVNGITVGFGVGVGDSVAVAIGDGVAMVTVSGPAGLLEVAGEVGPDLEAATSAIAVCCLADERCCGTFIRSIINAKTMRAATASV